jgi:chromate transporter
VRKRGRTLPAPWSWLLARAVSTGSPLLEVLLVFLRLGLSSFGGPIAHIGYFRNEFVTRRRWLDERAYADLVGLCQSLPGPSSSQLGFSLGLLRAGYRGALAAWLGFTLPSAVALVAFAYGAGTLRGPVGTGLIDGLKVVAVAIVAQAVWGMAAQFCRSLGGASIALGALLLVLSVHVALTQVGVIIGGGLGGMWVCRRAGAQAASRESVQLPVTRRAGVCSLVCFVTLLLGALWVSHESALPVAALFAAFYRSGALVFGGGHVVLPLLHTAFVGPAWVSDSEFLAGYGAAQAVPGPLFTFAAYLGAVAHTSPHGIAGALVGLIGIFLPGMLILLGALPFWASFRGRSGAQAVMDGVNAAVVGLLAAAFYDPIWKSSIEHPVDFALALSGFLLLTFQRLPPVVVVVVIALAAAGLAVFWKT